MQHPGLFHLVLARILTPKIFHFTGLSVYKAKMVPEDNPGGSVTVTYTPLIMAGIMSNVWVKTKRKKNA